MRFSEIRKLAWMGILIFIATQANGQKSYLPATVTGLPSLFNPNARILVADFDGDGDKDMLFQNGNISGVDIHYLKNNSNKSFTQFDANGLGNFVVAGTPFPGITFTFIMDAEKSTTGQTFGQRILDYDADGDQDIFEIRTTGPARILLLNAATGTYSVGALSPAFPTTLTNSVSRWITADIDSDGDEDVLYQSGNGSGTGIFLLRNDHGGTWTSIAAGSGGLFSTGPLTGVSFTKIGNTADITQYFFDADGDGDKDLYELTGSSSRYFARTGSTFTSTALPTGLITSLTPALFRMVPADYDKDGDIDLLFQRSNGSGTSISYLRNDHNGTFGLTNAVSGAFSGVTTPFGPASFNFISRAATNREQILVDVDGDADVDLLQLGSTATSVLLQTGNNLPVKLDYFTVTKRGVQVQVSWKTSEEINLDHFTVEHSLDAINFKSLQETNASGNSRGANYAYLHQNPVKGLQYYRLVEYDLDGSKTFFPVKSIQFEGMKEAVEVYPTQTNDRVTAYLKPSLFNRVELLDPMGRVLQSKQLKDEFEINFSLNAYSKGMYYLRFTGTGSSITERILKQ